MPEGDKDQGRVAVTIATLPRLFDQCRDFGFGQIFAGSKLGIGRSDRN